MPFRLGVTDEHVTKESIEKIIKLLYTDPCAIDKIIGSLESLRIFYGGATSGNTLVKDAPAMFIGWIFAARDDVPLQRINNSLAALREINSSQKAANEKTLDAFNKIVAVMRESRGVDNNGGFYLPGRMQLSALEATQGSFNVLWLGRICQVAGIPTHMASNEIMLACGNGIVNGLEALMKDPKGLERLLATFVQNTASTRQSHVHE